MIYEIADKCENEVKSIVDDYEIYIDTNKTIELDSKQDELNFAKEEIDQGIGIRVIKDNKIGFAFTSDLDKIDQTARQALENTKLNKIDENYQFALKEKVNDVNGIYDKNFDDLTLEEYIEYVNNIIAIVNDSECEISSAGFSASYGESLILNSEGVSIFNKGTGFSTGVSLSLEKEGRIATAYNSLSSRFFDIDGDNLASEVVKLASDSIDTKSIETGDYDVVLDYYAAVGLLGVFLQAFDGDSVLRQKSVLKDKVGQEITNSNLSIIDNPQLERGMGTTKCDGEGTPSKATSLVDNGILKSFIYDIYTANKAGVESTSNGYRGSYFTTPGISPSNVVLEFDKLTSIEEIDKGMLTTSVLGAHTANPITGDFSVEASNGFKIENGEITDPINKAMISGNIFELMKSCEGLKTEIKQYGPFVLPKLLVHDLRVIGND